MLTLMPLTPEHAAALARQRQFLLELEDVDEDARQAALAALDPQSLTDADLDQDAAHLAQEYRSRA